MVGKTFTYLIGADSSSLFFNSKNDDLNAEEVYSKLITPVFGRGVAYDVPNNVSARKVALVPMPYLTIGPLSGVHWSNEHHVINPLVQYIPMTLVRCRGNIGPLPREHWSGAMGMFVCCQGNIGPLPWEHWSFHYVTSYYACKLLMSLNFVVGGVACCHGFVTK